MKQQEIVTFAKVFSFTNDKGEHVEGGEIHVLSAKNTTKNDYGCSNGHKVAILKVPKEVSLQIMEKVPCLCDVEYIVTVGSSSNLILRAVGVHFVKAFNI